MRSEKPVRAPLTLSLRSFQNNDLETVPMFFGPLLFKGPAVLTTHFQSLKIICGIETVAKFQKIFQRQTIMEAGMETAVQMIELTRR